MTSVSSQRREDVIDALRAGAVPTRGLDLLAVGLGQFETAIVQELEKTRGGSSVFKAVRGDYGSGKTFFSRWLQDRARRMGFATAEVQISETETPLHRLEAVYRGSVNGCPLPLLKQEMFALSWMAGSTRWKKMCFRAARSLKTRRRNFLPRQKL